MALEVLERSMAERRRSTIGWCVGAAVYTMINVAVFPEVKTQSGLNDLLQEYPPALMAMMGIDAKTLDITSAVGYLSSQMNMIGPLLLVLVGIAFGSASLAGEEESGTLAMVLSYPVSRARVLVEKGAALLLVVALMASALLLTIVAGRLFDLDIPLAQVLAFCVSLALLGGVFGMLALAVGAATGSKAMGTGIGAVVAAATYLISSLAPVVSWVEPLRWASPFWYATGNNPLANGLAARDVAVLTASVVALWAIAVLAFDRRDLRG
jgi:ABC-2 type transport system permease protein